MHRNKRAAIRKRMPISRRISITTLLFCTILMLSQTAFAQNTFVIKDGNRIFVHTTNATDPADVLDEAGFELSADDTYIAQKENGVSEIQVRRVQTVYITIGGQTMTVGSYGETVAELLGRLHIDIDGDTDLSASPDSMTFDGMELKVSRTVTEAQSYTRMVPCQTTYCEDASISQGTQRVLVPGRNGEEVVTDQVVYRDGVEVSRVTINSRVTRQPVNEIVAVGTKDPAEDENEVPEKFQGMPVIGDHTITLPTGEVLTYTGIKKMVATGYNKENEGCDDYTATGTLARVGAIAVDPSVIPYGTRMYIVSDDGEYVYGIATAEDCGGDITENRIDLYFDSNYECFQFGVRDCTVYILG